jgi:addiction module RelE/StbE family toxin
MRIRYTPLALADREAIFQYLNERSPRGAANVIAAIRATAKQLAEQPYSGPSTEYPGIRVKLVGRYPYKLFYRIRDNTVELVHIRHTSRRSWETSA